MAVSRNWVTRGLFALCSGAWVSAWVAILARMGIVARPASLYALLGLLVLCQAPRSRWVRGVVATLVSIAAIGSRAWSRIPEPKSVEALVRDEASAVLDLLVRHAASALLTDTLFGLIFAILFALLMYSSQYVGLWLFYQALALFALLAIHLNMGISVGWGLCVVIATATVGSAALSLERMTNWVYRPWPFLRTMLPVGVLCAVMLAVGNALPPHPGWRWSTISNAFGAMFGSAKLPTQDSQKTLELARFNRVGFHAGAQGLGGSVALDYLPVLSVIEPNPAYIRGQVLETYTGHAWVPSSKTLVQLQNGVVPDLPDATFHNLTSESVRQTITVLGGGLRTRLVLGAYAATAVQGFSSALSVDTGNDILYLHGWLSSGQSYQVTSLEPTTPYKQLAQVRTPFTAQTLASLPGMSRYLALPTSFPARDLALAKEIAGPGATEYQKTERIRQYLETHEHYAISRIPVPGPNQDFVDQFLFQTHRGYCNQFSTSMAVLLRAVGIPTRWVTGFAAGTRDNAYAGPETRYVIRDSDAHSWVEAYFPGYGWIPFDPTPGFDLPFAAAHVGGTSGSTVTPGTTTPNQGGGSPSVPQTKPEPGKKSGSSARGFGIRGIPWGRVGRWGIGVAIVMSGIGTGVWWLNRRKRLRTKAGRGGKPAGWTAQRRSLTRVDTLIDTLLKQLGSRGQGVTIRRFRSAALEAGLTAGEFDEFVRCVERLWYGSVPLSDDERSAMDAVANRWLAALQRT